MSTTTKNYDLIKPELTDVADITAMNQNWDKIDEELAKATPKTRKVNGKTLESDITLEAKDVGLGNVPNVTTNDQTPTYSDTSELQTLVSGEKLAIAFQKIKLAITNLINHLGNKNNPHEVTAKQVGAAEANHKHPYAINIGYDRVDIPNGGDLNDILNMGCYRCSTATKASSLINCPTKNAFIMDMVASTGGNATVDPNSYSYGTQRIYSLGGREYVRQIISNGDGTIVYGDWITMYSTLDKPTLKELDAVNTAFSNIPDRALALKNIHATDNFKGTVNGIDIAFNTALTQGEYSVAGINMDNAPYTGSIYGKLVVYVSNGGTHDNASNWIWQVFYSTLNNTMYMRSKINEGVWSDWIKIYNQNNKPTMAELGAKTKTLVFTLEDGTEITEEVYVK